MRTSSNYALRLPASLKRAMSPLNTSIAPHSRRPKSRNGPRRRRRGGLALRKNGSPARDPEQGKGEKAYR